MKKEQLKVLVEGGICIGLGVVLGMINIYSMPQGGSVSLAALPLLVFAMRNGVKQGIFAGLIYGILQIVVGPIYSYHPVSLILDYLAAGAVLGLIAYGKWYYSIILVFAARFICYLLSGVIVFSNYAPKGQNPWVYSATYNLLYLIPEFIIIAVIIFALKKWSRVFKILE